jgi:hypothetical protein
MMGYPELFMDAMMILENMLMLLILILPLYVSVKWLINISGI